MKKPTQTFLLALARALREAEHQNVAEHMASGMVWAMYPEWFTKNYVPHTERNKERLEAQCKSQEK